MKLVEERKRRRRKIQTDPLPAALGRRSLYATSDQIVGNAGRDERSWATSVRMPRYHPEGAPALPPISLAAAWAYQTNGPTNLPDLAEGTVSICFHLCEHE